MAEQKQDDQLEHTYSSYVRIQDVALKTCQRRWMIRRSGERGSGISVLGARHDDDFVCIHIVVWKKSCFTLPVRFNFHMINNLSIAFHTFARRILILFSVDEILLPRYVNWATTFRGLPLRAEMVPFCLKHMYPGFLHLDMPVLADQQGLTSALCGHRMHARRPIKSGRWQGWMMRKSKGSSCCLWLDYNYFLKPLFLYSMWMKTAHRITFL